MKQMLRTTARRCCVVAWQCLSTYCCPHWWNPPETQVWLIAHPAYSPTLASSDYMYHLFDPLREVLGCCWCALDPELKEAMCICYTALLKLFFSEGIGKFVHWWTKCIEEQEDYVEIWCECRYSFYTEIKFIAILWIIVDLPIWIKCDKTLYEEWFFLGC
jgi:hypothetical protein